MVPLYLYQKKMIIPIYIQNKKDQAFLIIRGLLGAIIQVIALYTLTFLPLAELYSVMYTSPIFTGIIGIIILKEKFTKYEILCSLLGLLGIFLILKPKWLIEVF